MLVSNFFFPLFSTRRTPLLRVESFCSFGSVHAPPYRLNLLSRRTLLCTGPLALRPGTRLDDIRVR